MAGGIIAGLIGFLVLVPLALIAICVAIVIMCCSKGKRDA